MDAVDAVQVGCEFMNRHGKAPECRVADDVQEVDKQTMPTTKPFSENEGGFRAPSGCTFDARIFHEEGIAVDVNENFLAMTGYSREEIIGRNVIEIAIAPDHKEAVYARMRSGCADACESLMVCKDGSYVPVELKGYDVDFEDRKLRVEVMHDISLQRQLEKSLRDTRNEAEASSRLKDQFVALISHDLRSPLASIKGMLDIAKKEGPEGLLEMRNNGMFERIANSAGGLISLIERLLDHSRLQTGEIKPELRFINVRSLVDDRIGRISQLASTKGLSIRNFLPESMNIYADPDLYGAVVHNIVSNAIKFTPRGGEITILSPEESLVIVRDNGIGIEEQMLPDLFNVGVRTSTYGTDGEKGTGLGLPYSYNIMKAHGGNLTAQPAMSKGAEFHIELPKHTSIVLLVSDEDAQRSMVKEMIAGFGKVLVVEARNGAEALNLLRYFMPSIVITDIEMPVFDGFELVRWIRGLTKYELVPIMAVAAFADAESAEWRENLSSLGADDIIAKPLVEDEFQMIVARYLGIV